MVHGNVSGMPRPLIKGVEPPPSVSFLPGQPHAQIILVSTQVTDTDLFANVQHSFNHFIQSGQAWSLVIGFLLGYFLRGLFR